MGALAYVMALWALFSTFSLSRRIEELENQLEQENNDG